MKLDKWQEEVLKTEGDICLVSGRQVGKSEIWSIDASEWAIKNPKKTILMIASVERQAFGLFERTLNYLYNNHKKMVKKGKDRPTKTVLKLTNGSRIICLPTGVDGHGIRFLTVDRLYGDEAAFIPDEVWTAVTPMLVMTGGVMRLSSTPHGSQGFFYKKCIGGKFKIFHKNTREVILEREICATWTITQRDAAIEHLDEEEKNMTTLQYAQEYMGEFVSALRQVFPDKLIQECMSVQRRGDIRADRRYYLGVDVARMGDDESTFQIIDRTHEKDLRHVENQVTTKTLTTDTTKHIIGLNKLYDFKQIFIDDGGMGVGVFDQLLDTEDTRRKTVAINNMARPLDREEKQKKRTLKEDVYNNLLMLMERGEIKLLDDDEVFQSLKSVQFEINRETNKTKYFGNYTHIAEGLIRAAWCVKDKSLNIYVY